MGEKSKKYIYSCFLMYFLVKYTHKFIKLILIILNMSPTDSNILPIYPVEEGEMEVIHSNSIPEEKLTPATVVQLREHSLKLVEASLIVEKIFTGDAALERANHFRKIFLQRMKMIYEKMKRAKDQRPIQSQILDNWALESL